MILLDHTYKDSLHTRVWSSENDPIYTPYTYMIEEKMYAYSAVYREFIFIIDNIGRVAAVGFCTYSSNTVAIKYKPAQFVQ